MPAALEQLGQQTGSSDWSLRIETLPDFAEVMEQSTSSHAATLDGVWGFISGRSWRGASRAAPAMLVIVCPRLDRKMQGLIGDTQHLFSCGAGPIPRPWVPLSAAQWCPDERRLAITSAYYSRSAGPNTTQSAGDETCPAPLLPPVPSRAVWAAGRNAYSSTPATRFVQRVRPHGWSARLSEHDRRWIPGEFASPQQDRRRFCPRLLHRSGSSSWRRDRSIRPLRSESQRSRERFEAIDVRDSAGAFRVAILQLTMAGFALTPAPLPRREGRIAHLAEYLPPKS